MSDIYICGHGGWATIGRPSGFVNLPARTNFVMYEDIGSPLYVSDALKILSRDPGAPAPVRTVGAFKSAPDMTIAPALEFEPEFVASSHAGGARAEVIRGRATLSQLVQRYAGHTIHWIACSGRVLNRT